MMPPTLLWLYRLERDNKHGPTYLEDVGSCCHRPDLTAACDLSIGFMVESLLFDLFVTHSLRLCVPLLNTCVHAFLKALPLFLLRK